MGFMKNPLAFLRVLESVIQITGYRFIILTAGYEPIEAAICTIAQEPVKRSLQEGVSIFNGKLFCFSGLVQIFTIIKCKYICSSITYTYLCLFELVWCHTTGYFEDVLLQFIMVAGETFTWMVFINELGHIYIYI